MAHKAPGKAFRQGLSIKALFRKFPDDAAAEKQLAAWRWPDGVCCPEVRFGQHPRAAHPQASALSLPVLPQGLQRQDRHPHAQLALGVPDVVDRHLPDDHEPEGRL